MEHFSTEEQQVEAIKKFWKENGIAIVVGAVLGLGGLWGWRAYNQHVLTGQEQASDQYNQVIENLANPETGFTEAKAFVEAQKDSNYAGLTALQLAKEAVAREDFSEAEKQLSWAANNIDVKAIQEIALIRLARLQNETENYAGAMENLNKVVSEAYKAQVLAIKGDVLRNQGEFKQAQESYTEALALDENNSVLQMKIDDLNAKLNG